jgi:hypothetical protein
VDEQMMVFALLLNAIFIVGGVVVIVMAMSQRAKRLEMQHRERLAMIERGMVPSPETDPAHFEASLGRPAVSRYTTLGVAVVGVGVGVMLLIGVAGGAADAGVGVGGAIAVLGFAFIVNGYLRRDAHQGGSTAGPHSSRVGPPPPPGPFNQ